MNQATAHPHVDPDGTVYNMGNSFSGKKGPTYNIIKFPPAKEIDGMETQSCTVSVIKYLNTVDYSSLLVVLSNTILCSAWLGATVFYRNVDAISVFET